MGTPPLKWNMPEIIAKTAFLYRHALKSMGRRYLAYTFSPSRIAYPAPDYPDQSDYYRGRDNAHSGQDDSSFLFIIHKSKEVLVLTEI